MFHRQCNSSVSRKSTTPNPILWSVWGKSTAAAVSELLRCSEGIGQTGVTKETIHRLCIFIHFPFGKFVVACLNVFKFMVFYIWQ